MLNRRRDHVLRAAWQIPDQAKHGKIIRFGSATRENQFRGTGMDQGRKLAARRFQTLLGRLPEMMNAGRVTIRLTETRDHCLQHLGSYGGRGVMVEIRALHLEPF